MMDVRKSLDVVSEKLIFEFVPLTKDRSGNVDYKLSIEKTQMGKSIVQGYIFL